MHDKITHLLVHIQKIPSLVMSTEVSCSVSLEGGARISVLYLVCGVWMRLECLKPWGGLRAPCSLMGGRGVIITLSYLACPSSSMSSTCAGISISSSLLSKTLSEIVLGSSTKSLLKYGTSLRLGYSFTLPVLCRILLPCATMALFSSRSGSSFWTTS